jgi:hypothetical protein
VSIEYEYKPVCRKLTSVIMELTKVLAIKWVLLYKCGASVAATK